MKKHWRNITIKFPETVEAVVGSLVKDGSVRIHGFGTFKIASRKRSYYDINTGKMVKKRGTSKYVTFSASREFTEKIN